MLADIESAQTKGDKHQPGQEVLGQKPFHGVSLPAIFTLCRDGSRRKSQRATVSADAYAKLTRRQRAPLAGTKHSRCKVHFPPQSGPAETPPLLRFAAGIPNETELGSGVGEEAD
jgi:hypothetical protein